MTYEELLAVDPDFDDSVAAEVGPDDLLTLIYTSGTTGPPKGVQLTHRNLMSLVSSVEDMIPFPEDSENRVISWLPAAHIAERGAHYYLPVVMGVSVTICSDPRKIIEVLPQVRPTWFFAVPRIWEKLKAGLETMIANLPDGAARAGPAGPRGGARQGPGRAGRGGGARGRSPRAPPRPRRGCSRALRAKLGLDQVVAVNVGAAPTPLEVLEFFHAIGVPIGELWGMSETCGVATLNPPEKVKLGTVGPPTPGNRDQARRGRRGARPRRLDHGRLPQHAGEDGRDDRRRRLALDRRHRRARRRRLPEDRRPQEGADHQRRRQEHVAGVDRGAT